MNVKGTANSKAVERECASPDQAQCEAIRVTLRTFADRQSLLILCAALHGVSRFEAFKRRIDISRNILSRRLARLVDADLLEKRPMNGPHLEYIPTERGEALRSVLEAMVRWHAEQGGVGRLQSAEDDRHAQPTAEVSLGR